MLTRALLRKAVALRAASRTNGAGASRLAIKRLSTEAADTSAVANSSSSLFSAVGRDIPLNVVSRQARRQARKLEKQPGAGGISDAATVKGVRTSSLPSKISFALLAGSVSGSVLWHFLLDEATKKSITDTLSATFLGDIYAFGATKVEELFRPFTEPSREKLLPVCPLPCALAKERCGRNGAD